jgi:hypothetical protein
MQEKNKKSEAGYLCGAVLEFLLPETVPLCSAIQILFSRIEAALSLNNGTRYTLPGVSLADV